MASFRSHMGDMGAYRSMLRLLPDSVGMPSRRSMPLVKPVHTMIRVRVNRELDSPQAITELVDAFYAKAVADAILAPIFEELDLELHLPKVYAYWRKMLLSERDVYRRNMIAKHRQLHDRYPLQHRHFQRWLTLFEETVDERFAGHAAIRAKRLASTVATHLENLIHHTWHEGGEHEQA